MDSHGLMHKTHTCLCCGETALSVRELGVGGSGRRAIIECTACKAKGKLSNQEPWRGRELPEDKLRSIFGMANIKIRDLKKLPNGYWGFLEDEAHPWWFVKTQVGWIEIGWRKRVIAIDWSDTPIRHIVTADEVTKGADSVHAYSEEDAAKYLKVLGEQFMHMIKLNQSLGEST